MSSTREGGEGRWCGVSDVSWLSPEQFRLITPDMAWHGKEGALHASLLLLLILLWREQESLSTLLTIITIMSFTDGTGLAVTLVALPSV